MKAQNQKKGQAVVELAIFGSIILVAFGILLSYLQRMNDQQYVQMEAFRRGLAKACTYLGETSEGAGASVQYTLMQDRRYVDLSGDLGKGSSTTLSASSSVFWPVPKVGAPAAENLLVYKINEDERSRNWQEFVPAEHADDWTFYIEPLQSGDGSLFNESISKEESPERIVNAKTSSLEEERTVIIPYTIRKKDNDDNEENDEIVKEGTFWEGEGTILQGYGSDWDGKEALVQHLYRDSDGQYKYSSQAPTGTTVERSRTWVTETGR